MTDRPASAESAFHDQWAAGIDVGTIDVDVQFTGSTAPENRWIVPRLGDLRGKLVLDLGCGAGEAAVYFARLGAHSVACDLSPGMLGVARRLGERHMVTVEPCRCSAERLPFTDSSVDIVYAANVLHHTDPVVALREIRRVLKPGGMAATWDPLRHNPVINLYRRISPKVHSHDERPLHITVVRTARSLFAHVEYGTFWLATLWLFVRFFLIERADPNRERYWKKIHTDEARLRGTYLKLERIDRVLLKLPFLRRFAWNLAMVIRK